VLYRKSGLAVLLGLIFLSFFGTLALSAWMFPQNYDWRYRVISNLLSARDNPAHHWLPACGVALTGLFMLPFVGYLRRQLEVVAPRVSLISAAAFLAGIVALIATCLIVPQHAHALLGIRRFHEFLARLSAGFLAIGMLCGCWCAWKGIRPPFQTETVRLFWTWSFVTLFPLTGLFVSEALLLLTRFKPALAAPIRNGLRHSVFWHLGFWEWTGAVAVFAFLCAAVFLTPPQATSKIDLQLPTKHK